MPLTMLTQGASGVIREVRGKAEAVRHLADLGFVAGETIRVVAEQSGNLIVELKGSRLALNKVTASRIILAE